MRLMQHMLPGLLSETDVYAAAAPVLKVPVFDPSAFGYDPQRGIPQKSIVAAIAGVVGGIANPIATIVTSPGNNRTAQELSRQETLRTEMLLADAEKSRAANMQMLKYAVGAAVVALALYLLFR